MEAADALASAPKRSAGRRLADLFHGRGGLQAGALLTAPLTWLVILYLGSLAVMLVAAFWSISPLSGELVKSPLTLVNFKTLINEPVYRTIALRTIAIASRSCGIDSDGDDIVAATADNRSAAPTDGDAIFSRARVRRFRSGVTKSIR